jgi:lysophospholipase L1-like esterase
MKKTTRSTHAKRLLATILLSAATASAAGETPSVPPAAPMPVMDLKPGNWVVMGSSSAVGRGAPRGKGWVALVGAAFAPSGAQMVNIATSGAVTYQGLSTSALRTARRPPPGRANNIDAALAYKPVALIVSYPSNDTAAGYRVDETVNNLLAIRKQAQAAGVAVVVVSTQPRSLDETHMAQLRAIDDRLAASVGACFVEVREALAGADGRLAPKYDGGMGYIQAGRGMPSLPST